VQIHARTCGGRTVSCISCPGKRKFLVRHLRGENVSNLGVYSGICISLVKLRNSLGSFPSIRKVLKGHFGQQGGRESKQRGPK
jgi:hypothetical protein